MNELIKAISTGFTAFTATNLDDLLILLLFFSQVNTLFRRRHIVTGQYLGFTALVVVSLSGFFGGFLFPRPWIGMLGLVPIAIGFSRLLNPDEEDESAPELTTQVPARSRLASLISPQTYTVGAITFANGGDNIGIYVPLFASCTWQSLSVILGVFFTLVGVWCYVAYRLTQVPAIAHTLTNYGNQLIPFVLIGIGGLILVDSGTLANQGLAVLSLVVAGLTLLMLMRQVAKSVEVLPEAEK